MFQKINNSFVPNAKFGFPMLSGSTMQREHQYTLKLSDKVRQGYK